MIDFETLLIERVGAVATVTMNRPESMNAFNSVLRRELLVAARELNLDTSIHVVVLTGAGRAFGAGADLAEEQGEGMGLGPEVEDQLEYEYKPGVLAIAESSKVWIAAVNGPCAGISYSYAMACDMVVMADSAFLYQPFAAIGLIPDGGSTWLLSRLVGPRRAFELMICGEKVTAEKAVALGLANHCFDDDGFKEQAAQFAQTIASKSPLALRYTKEALRISGNSHLGDAISAEAKLQKLCIDSDDCKGAINAFLAKKTYVWQGH